MHFSVKPFHNPQHQECTHFQYRIFLRTHVNLLLQAFSFIHLLLDAPTLNFVPCLRFYYHHFSSPSVIENRYLSLAPQQTATAPSFTLRFVFKLGFLLCLQVVVFEDSHSSTHLWLRVELSFL